MSEKRMFSKQITESDAFIDMSLSAQALYFHLGMAADDDGFINAPKRIQRMVGASDDDLKLLILKKFVIPFESGIVVIKHWKINNYIRADRHKETAYPEEMAMLTVKENGSYSLALEDTETKRQAAYRESELPYSFDYKIRQKFYGKPCPVCGALMQRSVEDGVVTTNRMPTVQHNIPIAKGGKHALGNISVICKECNISLRDTETGDLNAEEVVWAWDELCQAGASQLTVNCQASGSIDKNRLDKNRLNSSSRGGRVNLLNMLTPEETSALFATYEDADYLIDEVEADINRKMKGAEIDNFYRYVIGYASNKGWLTNEQ